MRRLISYAILFMYTLLYNDYFGHNWVPKSGEEAICDGIATLGFILIYLRNIEND